jgi:hypothetical protein
MNTPDFRPFPKIPRLRRELVVTEKIDGTNAIVYVGPEGQVQAGSRSRWITPEADNFGFAKWVAEHVDELKMLGPGYHYGEWYGSGIQRGYGLLNGDKRFALFNVDRWRDGRAPRPACCGVVPVLGQGTGEDVVEAALERLRDEGSVVVPGFKKPEGVVVYHRASQSLYKVTLDNDEAPKGAQ